MRLGIIAAFALCTGLSEATSADDAAPYRVDHKAPLRAQEKLVEDKDGYRLYRVEFNGVKGDRVPGNLYLPTESKSRLPAALVQHGIGDKKQSAYITATCRMLAGKGVVALAIDAPNRGERRQKGQDTSVLNPASVQTWFRQHCGDYSRAFDYLASRSDVNAERMGYIGFSWGGITGITFAAHDPRVKAMACVGAGGNFGDYLDAPAKPDSKDPHQPPLDPARHVGAFAPRPLLLVSAKRDLIVLPMFAKALHKAAGEGSQVEWHDTDHYFAGTDREKILDSVAEFLKTNLVKSK